ncbi:hypothetical protein P7K49_017309 [Saguinus oedipus]|uniref:Uncharacterized protein n=1 Tax=Saguinus oedipus TaxID=9490 RepID=A0ABQ9V256_SAGOE|nr:hypothetical protein P7K49_017309 [Saguinus oedipus]
MGLAPAWARADPGEEPAPGADEDESAVLDVLQIHIGSTPVVVLSGLDTIWQALMWQGNDFKGRPNLYSFTLITGGQSMSFSPDSGPVRAACQHLAQNALDTFSITSCSPEAALQAPVAPGRSVSAEPGLGGCSTGAAGADGLGHAAHGHPFPFTVAGP